MTTDILITLSTVSSSIDNWWKIFIIVTVAIHLLLIYPFLLYTAHMIILHTMKRTNKNMWSRDSVHDDDESRAMRLDGMNWAKKHAQYKKDLHLVNEGLNLYGEYYDLGYDRAVIIIPGRTDGLHYSYHFANPYSESGYNVLCIDQRAHGESDGEYNSMGFNECRDAVAWARLLHDTEGVKTVFLHGICIGSACSLYAMLEPGSPDYIVGMVADGMYPNFYESFKLHMIEFKKPTFIVLDLVDKELIRATGHSSKVGPIDFIDKYDRPILMLHGTSDSYSLPEKAEMLYTKCASTNKKLVWFEGGTHSKLRISNPEKYDAEIKAFLAGIHEGQLTG